MSKIDPFLEQESEHQRRLDLLASLNAFNAAHAKVTDEYDRLPEPIRMTYSRQEYLWLSDVEKATLFHRECDPEA